MGDGVGDTPQTVMTTRAPAVLKTTSFYKQLPIVIYKKLDAPNSDL